MVGAWFVGSNVWDLGSVIANIVIEVVVLGAVYVIVLATLRGIPEDIVALGKGPLLRSGRFLAHLGRGRWVSERRNGGHSR
jgi:hypothetical protein